LPELPEVETIKRELAPHVVGRTFASVTICDDKPIKQPEPERFCQNLAGQRIDRLERRGKYLIFHLSSGQALIVHLRMTGALLLNPRDPNHARVIFHFDDSSQLAFTDRRRLGAIWLAEDAKAVTRKLGPEPLEAHFTTEILAKLLQKRQAPIKAVLLDQSLIAGIGNMYADEALFLARIHPLRQANSLSHQEVQELYQAIRQVLQKAIDSKGASIDTYKRPGGATGAAHQDFHVAHQKGKPCPKCFTPIERLPIRNRGSYFCPRCQAI